MSDEVMIMTAAGLVRGRHNDGVSSFKGIPYGGNISGRRRWQRSTPILPWPGALDALELGPRAIQPESRDMHVTGDELEELMQAGGPADDRWRRQSEECLTVNIWTPKASDARRRPVLFWCHGGKYFGETPPAWWFDGEALARREDVVVVTVRHRVGVLGFLHLADLPGGEAYPDAGNVGMLDLVDALTWVRDNIANFGGDPANVTIFGESGGGLKVSVLLAMPAAEGLFHKAIIQSGAQLEAKTRDEGTGTALSLLDTLGLAPTEISKLSDVPAEDLVRAQVRLAPSLVARPTRKPVEFEPVADGTTIPSGSLDPARAISSGEVPLLIGTCATEATFFLSAMPSFGAIADDQLTGMLGGMFGSKADQLLATYRSNRPAADPTEILTAIFGDFIFWRKAIAMAEGRANRGQAITFMYVLAFATDVHEGKYHTPHTLDLPLVFAHPDHPVLGSDSARHVVSLQMSGAWAAFARSGSPQHPTLPDWPAFDTSSRASMCFARQPRVEYDPRSAERAVWQLFKT